MLLRMVGAWVALLVCVFYHHAVSCVVTVMVFSKLFNQHQSSPVLSSLVTRQEDFLAMENEELLRQDTASSETKIPRTLLQPTYDSESFAENLLKLYNREVVEYA